MPKQAPKLLIVDDERTILLSLSHLLESKGVELITCNRKEFAKTAIDNHHFSLVLLDLRLSGMDENEGLELLSFIKERSKRTKVIVMTAYGSEEIKQEVVKRGADHYFDKPINIEHLRQKIRELGIPLKT